jgi:hypothetical protein
VAEAGNPVVLVSGQTENVFALNVEQRLPISDQLLATNIAVLNAANQ